MSRVEHHVGTAQEICVQQDTFEAKYTFAVNEFGLTYDEADEEGYIEDNNFFYLKKPNKMFRILSNIENEYGHCVIREDVSDPSIYHYTLSFYNRGGGFDEVFEDALNKSGLD